MDEDLVRENPIEEPSQDSEGEEGLFPHKVREDLVEMALNRNAESDPLFQSHIIESPLQAREAETPRFNKILGRISTILSILGFIGSAVIFMLSFACPPAPLILGLIIPCISLLGVACDIANRWTDHEKYTIARNSSLGAQIVAYAAKIVCEFAARIFPIIATLKAPIEGMATIIGFIGLLCETLSDCRNKRLDKEYSMIGNIRTDLQQSRQINELINQANAMLLQRNEANLSTLQIENIKNFREQVNALLREIRTARDRDLRSELMTQMSNLLLSWESEMS
ncbi:MAG: hypothetical protein LBF42_03135 [Puniceicoccales bacterium]|jgi:hypothetical protein|nr:hypothetical protein [Puniceicoccales bacterium]